MDHGGDPWVRRLRDGATPESWPLVVGLSVTLLASALVTLAEITNPGVVSEVSRSRSGFVLLLVPIGFVIACPVIAIASWVRGQQDRRVLARIRPRSSPAFFLPVVTSSIREADALPRPRPTIWTVDRAGLHGWAPRMDAPVLEVPWASITSIGLAETWNRGQPTSYGIWLDTDDGHLVLRPRTALGRPVEAGQTKLDILMRVLRSLRRELDMRTHDVA